MMRHAHVQHHHLFSLVLFFSYFLIFNNIMPATVCFVYQRTMQTTFAGSKSSIKCPENFIQNGGKKMSSQMREFVQV